MPIGIVRIRRQERDLGTVRTPNRPDDVDGIGELAGLAPVRRYQPERAVVAEEDRAVLALQQTQPAARAVVSAVKRDQLPQCPLRGRPVADGLGGVDIAPQLGGQETARILEASDRVAERGRLLRHGRQ